MRPRPPHRVARRRSPKRGRPGSRAEYSREQLRLDLLRGVVTEPLLTRIREAPDQPYNIIVALNEAFPEGVDSAFELVTEALAQLKPPPPQAPRRSASYVFLRLTGQQIQDVAAMYRDWVKTQGDRFKSPVYRVWEDARSVRA